MNITQGEAEQMMYDFGIRVVNGEVVDIVKYNNRI